MNNKLYKLMNWPEIEEIIYSDGDDPHRILGAHKVGGNYLVQAFFPDAEQVDIKIEGRNGAVKMEMADEAGFFAALIPYKDKVRYRYVVTDAEGRQRETADAYTFPALITREDTIRFGNGLHYYIYEKLGAHPMVRDGIAGCEFAVWVPDVARVSVVGTFNNWDGRLHQMKQIEKSGIYEVFVPGAASGDEYQFEIKTRQGILLKKPDPYAFRARDAHAEVSIITDDTEFAWTDDNFLANRRNIKKDEAAMSIGEIYVEDFAAYRSDKKKEKTRVTYREIATDILNYVDRCGYTTVVLLPVMEHHVANPYEITGFFALSGTGGNASDFRYLVNALHAVGVRVLIDWVPTFFPSKDCGMAGYNGNALYEYGGDKGIQPYTGYRLFDLGRKQVTDYLLSNAVYWMDSFHIDGFRLPDISKVIYLDYDRAPGAWMPNVYGGNENLEALEFFRQFTEICRKRDPGILTITRETACFPQVTAETGDGGLGFTYKINNGWSEDFLRYLDNDPIRRGGVHNELTFSLIYCYTERFLLSLGSDALPGGLHSLAERQPGDDDAREAGVRLAVAYMYTHPGGKSLYAGAEYGLDKSHEGFAQMLQALNRLYEREPALHVLDRSEAGFEWINCMASDACMLSFLRKGRKPTENLVVVVNFAGIAQNFTVGVPNDGKYKEIFNSDDRKFGGSGTVNRQTIEAKRRAGDGRLYSIEVKLAPLSVAIFDYAPYTEQEKKIRAIREQDEIRKEEERAEKMALLKQKKEKEQEKLLEDLKARYEKELAEQEKAIEEKYARIEEERVKKIMAGKEAPAKQAAKSGAAKASSGKSAAKASGKTAAAKGTAKASAKTAAKKKQ
ncbi:MAG: 1,4-alpha-glucan branching enzyme [Lachnospiraceae bacterium]|nr:1,4-alpha-glucan branching enzyme [Lachnospiraceae bacterium]